MSVFGRKCRTDKLGHKKINLVVGRIGREGNGAKTRWREGKL